MKATEVRQAASTDTPTPPNPPTPHPGQMQQELHLEVLGNLFRRFAALLGFGKKVRVVTILVAVSGDGEEMGSAKPFC